MATVLQSLEEATTFVNKYKNTFKAQSVRSQMNTTDAEHTVKLQLKSFQKEYDAIQKGNKRIEKTTDVRVKEEYIRRQECDYRVLARKIHSWFEHYKKDVVHAIDIVINKHMLNRSKRPFRCRPPVCDAHSRYYFGRTVCKGKTLAIRANYEGAFLIQGWLFYDPNTGADIELFNHFLPYTEDNVAKFMTDMVLFDDEATRTTNAPEQEHETTANTYQHNVMPTTLVVYEPPNDEPEEELSEEANYKRCQEVEQPAETAVQTDCEVQEGDIDDDDDEDDEDDDDEDDEDEDEDDDDEDDDDDDDNEDEDDDDDDEDDDDDDEDDEDNKPDKNVTKDAPPPTRHLTFEQQQGIYVHTEGLKEHLTKQFTYASLDVHALIRTRYSRRTRLYALKESAYKKLVLGAMSVEPSPKEQCDTLRRMLLGLWKTKAFICSPDALAKMEACVSEEYVHVLDGVL